MALAAPEVEDRLIMMTSTTKTFNLAGMHTGNVIIPNETLREKFNKTMVSYGISPNSFGKHMVAAAYCQEGADWVDALMIYIAENQRIFNSSMNSIPGVNSMELEGTYLCWVDFSNTGMQNEEVLNRVEKVAKIAVSRGSTFGNGGETFLRFNVATQRALIFDALERLKRAFADLQ